MTKVAWSFGMVWVTLFACSLLLTSSVLAQPAGYSLINSDNGVALYRNGGDHVQVISLKDGALVQLDHGAIDPSGGAGTHPIWKQSLESFWSTAASGPDAFSVTNGQFFSTSADPTSLAFSVKADGQMLYLGYGDLTEFVGQKMMLEIWSDHVAISSYDDNWLTVSNSSAPNVIVGLREDADKGISTTTGRTFAGCRDTDGNGSRDVLYIFNSAGSTQPHAAQVLRDFGATEVLMFDGGGSTQMICQGTGYIGSSRDIPQVFSVRAAADYRCSHYDQSPDDWFWTKPGNIHTFSVQYRNDGSISWVNSGGVGVANYVELWSCDVSGNIVNSWFEPVGWINRQRIVPCDETSVPSGTVATFTFQGEIPATTTRDVKVYFRPTHGGVVMEDWGGMHYPIHVDADNPTIPSSVTASPSSSNTNAFSFNWSASSDSHSGVSGYYWKINGGGETFTTGTSIPSGSYAPSDGTHTFYVRAFDNVGNSSGSGSATFAYNAGPCGAPLPSCGAVSDSWVDLEGNDAASYEDYVVRLEPQSQEDWARIGQDISSVFEPEREYRLGFWYRTSDNSPFSWGLQGSEKGSIPKLIMTIDHPTADGEWHQYWSAPVRVSEQQLSNSPILFLGKNGSGGLVEILEVELYDAAAPARKPRSSSQSSE